MDSVNEESEEANIFEVFQPGEYEDGIKRETELKKISEIMSLMENTFTEVIENPAIFDIVMDEGKKEEKKPVKKDAKGKIIVEEEPEVTVSDPIDYSSLLMRGPRSVSILPLHYNLS